MNTKIFKPINRILSATIIFLLVSVNILIMPINVKAQVDNPTFDVFTFYGRRVEGWGWPLETEITLTIDDPSNGEGVDYQASSYATMYDVIPDLTIVPFPLDDMSFDLSPGQLFTMTDGTTVKSLTLEDIRVTNVDVDADIIMGITEAYREVTVNLYEDAPYRTAIADAGGYWSADFSVEQEDQGVYDLHYDMEGHAIIHDEDGDGSVSQWSIHNPGINARHNDDCMQGWGWFLGRTLTIEFDDPSTSETPDFNTSLVIEGMEWDPNYSFDIHIDGFDIKTGDIITASDGTITKNLTVDNLTFTSVDLEADIVYGTAQPFQEIDVWTCDEYGCDPHRNVSADSDGYWLANFAVPGVNEGEEFVADLKLGTWIDSGVFDEDGDRTMFGFTIPNPVIFSRANDDQIEGWDWPIGETVTIEVDDPATEDNPDYTRSVLVEIIEGDPHSFLFFTEDYDLRPGDIVTAYTDTPVYGLLTKTLNVSSLTITNVDLELDIVYGIAEPLRSLSIWPCDETSCDPNRTVTADEFGEWAADFGNPGPNEGEELVSDLRPKLWIDSNTWDDDGDASFYGITIPNPVIYTRANDDQIEGWEWPIGETVTIDVDDPATEANPDFTRTVLVEIVEGDPHSFLFFTEDYDLKPGDVITASGTTVTKVLIVENLTISDINLEADIVYGIAEPEQSLEALACDSFTCYPRYVTADIEGNWSADFSIPGIQEGEDLIVDLRHGVWIDSLVSDDDDDKTLYGFTIDTSVDFLPWVQVNDDGFGNPENMQIPSLATFKGKLYAGVWGWHDEQTYAEVWRTDGSVWENVDHRDANGCAAMISYNGYLYCGSWNKDDEGGRIWRSADGLTWVEDVTYDSEGIARFAIYDDVLFASTWNSDGTEIWQTTNGVNWTLSTTPGFGDSANIGAIASELFHGKLYWGTLNFETGAQIWRTKGVYYEQVLDDGFGSIENFGITALSKFGGFLYAATGNPTRIEVWRTSNGIKWENVLILPMYLYPLDDILINGLEVLDGYLYLVGRNDMTGLEVWRTANGTEWIQVAYGGFDDGGNHLSYWDNAITTYKDKLFIATNNFGSGGEVWTFLPGE